MEERKTLNIELPQRGTAVISEDSQKLLRRPPYRTG